MRIQAWHAYPAMIVLQVKKGLTLKVHSHTLLKARIANLGQANKAASERKSRKRKQIQKGGDISKAEAAELVAQKDAEAQVGEGMQEGRAQAGASSVRKRYRSKIGHNSRTCKKDVVDLSN